MSTFSSVISWFDQLLFGTGSNRLVRPTEELCVTVAKLDAEHVDWREAARQGGILLHPYKIQADVDAVIDHLEHPDAEPPTLQTRCITTLLNHLLAHSARLTPAATVPEDDRDTLERILADGTRGPYVSAEFWGELARHWLNNRRPLPEGLEPLDDDDDETHDDLARLYDVTSHARGEKLDPLDAHLVPHAEYVNAIHWQSGPQLEAFVRSDPDHALSRSVRELVLDAFHRFLNGEAAEVVAGDHRVDQFLRNVSVAHETIPTVHLLRTPPRLVDVFQRLLALAGLDDLWVGEEDGAAREEVGRKERHHTQLSQLTEQLLRAERQLHALQVLRQ